MPRVDILPVRWPSARAFALDLVTTAMRHGLTLQAAELLTAHFALSTGWGRAADNYRLAGIKCTSPASQDYVELTGFEYVNGQKVSALMKWRAYRTLDDGVAAVVGLLQVKRYRAAWGLLVAGCEGYFAQVGRDGWYTADPESTAAQMRTCLATIHEYMKQAFGLQGLALVAALAAVGGVL